jgi:hypothetical protein
MWPIFKPIIAAFSRPWESPEARAFAKKAARRIDRIDRRNRDETVPSVCKLYSTANAPQRHYIRSLVDRDLAEQLLAFAHAKATALLRNGTEDDLRVALFALAIENQVAEDFRITLAHLAMLHHAAQKRGYDFDAQVAAASELCSESTSKLFLGFVKREPRLKTIEAFGFEERDGGIVWRY